MTLTFKAYLNETSMIESLESILETVKKYGVDHRIFQGGMFKKPNRYDIMIMHEASGLLDELHTKHNFGKVRGMNPHLIKKINEIVTIEAGNPNWVIDKNNPIRNVSILAEYQKYFSDDVIEKFDNFFEFDTEKEFIQNS